MEGMAVSFPCSYQTMVVIPERRPGACDGGENYYFCNRSALVKCDDCGAAFCGYHMKVCQDCGRVFCFAETDEETCFAEHEHAHQPMAIELELARGRQIA
jgi:hypothetical protein